MEKTIDCVVIGGGINGCGIAHEAAQRGLSVALLERNDLASGTSSKSSKLIHGGLRYLEHGAFNLVRKALREREILMRLAPHLIQPLQFVLPHNTGMRPRWLIRAGLFLYDHLSPRHHLAASTAFKLDSDPRGTPLESVYQHAFSYADCSVDDTRLVIANAQAAKQHGAIILTHSTITTMTYQDDTWLIDVLNQSGHHHFRAKILINAAGPWVEDIGQRFLNAQTTYPLTLSKGSHIVIAKSYPGDQAYLLQHADQRIVFVIPYFGHTLIGTTDIPCQQASDNLTVDDIEIDYLCETYNQYFKRKINRHDVHHCYAGVRPLLPTQGHLANVSRDYQIKIDKSAQHPLLVTIIGGKITTYRQLAQQLLNQLQNFYPGIHHQSSILSPLPGGSDVKNVTELYNRLQQTYSKWDEDILKRLARSYGSQAFALLKSSPSPHQAGQLFAHGLYEAEIDYLRQQEWAQSADDILWRRSKLGLQFSPQEAHVLAQYLG